MNKIIVCSLALASGFCMPKVLADESKAKSSIHLPSTAYLQFSAFPEQDAALGYKYRWSPQWSFGFEFNQKNFDYDDGRGRELFPGNPFDTDTRGDEPVVRFESPHGQGNQAMAYALMHATRSLYARFGLQWSRARYGFTYTDVDLGTRWRYRESIDRPAFVLAVGNEWYVRFLRLGLYFGFDWIRVDYGVPKRSKSEEWGPGESAPLRAWASDFDGAEALRSASRLDQELRLLSVVHLGVAF